MFEVHPDNWNAIEAFLAMQTQWRIAVGLGGAARIGLDYAALPMVFSGLRVAPKDRPDIWSDLRIMEAAALKEFGSRPADGDG